ncbi:hypothetical protein [Amycolatopsis speibonae]|uniref:Uncharacterized protein n=1 Tax=Amycolatopsis speibonae TaxID=1450224 RepID=A0ABV7P631_9PSEU
MDWIAEMQDESRRSYDNGGDLPVGFIQILNDTVPEPVYVGGDQIGGNECPAPKPPAPDA